MLKVSVICFFLSLLILRSQENVTLDNDDLGGEEGIFSIKYSYVVKTVINTYYLNNQVYIPITDLFDLLKINFNYDYEGNKMNGFFIKMDSTYEIDFNKKSAKMNNRHYSYNEDEYIRLKTGYYFTADFFNRVFNLGLESKFNKLTLLINTKTDLPVLLEAKRKKSFSFLMPEQKDMFGNSPLLFDRDRNWLNLGIIEYRLHGNYTNMEKYFSGTINTGFELLGGDFSTSISTYYRDPGNYLKFQSEPRWRYYLGDNNILTQFTIGNIINLNTRRTNLPFYNYRGLSISNEKTQRPNYFDEIRIRDKIEPGWVVELYKNGQMVGQTITDVQGYFDFSLPVNYGNSNIELKYYGPTGEIISKRDVIQIPLNFLKPFELRYSIDIGEKNNSTDIFGNARISMGLTNWLTNTFDFKYNDIDKTYNYRNESSIRINNNINLSLNYFHNELIRGYLDVWTTNFGSYHLMYMRNQGENEFFSKYLQNAVEFDFSLPKYITGLSLYTRNRLYDYTNYMALNSNAQLFLYFSQLNITANYTFDATHDKKINIDKYFQKASLQVGYNFFKPDRDAFFGSSKIQISSDYDITTHSLRSINLQISQQIAKNFSLIFNSKYDVFTKLTVYQLNIYSNWDFFRSVTTAIQTSNLSSVSQELNGTVAIGSWFSDLIFSSPNFSANYGSGAAKIRVFLDDNGNLKYDEDEELLPNVKVNIPEASIKVRDDSKIKYAFSLTPYSRYNVILDPKSIKNPNFVPKFTEFSFIADPNVIKPIDIPVMVTGIIEGNVLRQVGGEQKGQAGVKIHIMSEDSSYHETQPVFSDGSFYKMGLLPGNYLAWVDSLQCAILEVYQQDTVKRFTVKSTKTGDFIEGLDFVLIDLKVKDKKKILIDTISTPIMPEEEIRIDTLVNGNGNGKNDDRKPVKKLPESKNDIVKDAPIVKLLYKESKWTWLSIPMQKELDKLAKYLLENPNTKAQIDGHSDNFGTLEENMKISEQRAKEVVGYLYRKGIPLSRLYSSGHGALYPEGDNKTSEGRAKNRRVEIKIIE